MWLLRMPPNSSVRVYFAIFYINSSPFILSLPISKVMLSFGSSPKSVIFVTGGGGGGGGRGHGKYSSWEIWTYLQ